MSDKGKLLSSAHKICDEARDAGLINIIQKQYPVTITIGKIDVRKKLGNNTKIIRFIKKGTQSFEMIFIRPEVTQFFMINLKIPGLIEEIIIAVRKKFKSYMVEYDQSAPAEGQETNNIPTLPKINKAVLREIYTIISGSELDQTKTELLMLLFSKLYLKEFNPEELKSEVFEILQKIFEDSQRLKLEGDKTDEKPKQTAENVTSYSDQVIINNLIRLMEFTSFDREENPAIKYIKEFLSKIIQTVIQLKPHADILEACYETIREVLKSKEILLAILDELIEEKTKLSTDRRIETAGIEKTLSETTDASFRTGNRLAEISGEIQKIEQRNNERFAAIGNLTTDIKNLPRINEISQQIQAEGKRVDALNLEAQTLNKECLEHRRKEDILRDKLAGINKGIERLNSEIDMLNSSKATIMIIIEGRFELSDSKDDIKVDEFPQKESLPLAKETIENEENVQPFYSQKLLATILNLDLLKPYQFFKQNDISMVRKLGNLGIKLSDVFMRLIAGSDKLQTYLVGYQTKTEYAIRIADRVYELAKSYGMFDLDGNFDIEATSTYISSKINVIKIPAAETIIKQENAGETMSYQSTRILRKILQPLETVDVAQLLNATNLDFDQHTIKTISRRTLSDLLVLTVHGHIVMELQSEVGFPTARKLSQFLRDLKIVGRQKQKQVNLVNLKALTAKT